ncbi:MAG: energy-coupling factor transporter ATPase [Clostridia bacterium]|nr:energy-coupling factor transporter ATPase [Clostridia bacterium]
MSLLEVKNVSFSYEKNKTTIKGVSFSVEKGEFVAIIGHNGSGKSTLAKLLNGLLKPSGGEIIVGGYSSKDKSALFEIRKRVGMVFQNPDNQLIASIVEDDIAFGPENLGIPREEIGERIDFALRSVGMEKFRKASPERLSGGQKQRIAIAGVLALKPHILVLDESTAMLDPQGRKEIAEVVDDLRKQGVAVIAITHYMDEAVKADKILVLDRGEIAISGTPKEVFSQKERLGELGLELPLAGIIAEKLCARGVNVGGVVSETELTEALWKLL